MNNSLLAILLKNFRWLNYQLKPYFVQGDKSHLYVIQFTRYSSKSPRGDSFSLAQLQAFVKHFFKIFKSFCWRLSLSAESFMILSSNTEFVKHFFQFFQKKVCILSSSASYALFCVIYSLFLWFFPHKPVKLPTAQR